jgi:hypothetical protein
MQPFKDDLIFSKPSTTYFWLSLAVLVAIAIVAVIITPDDDSGSSFVTAIEVITTAGATGLAVRRGWFIGTNAYNSLYGTTRVPLLDKLGVVWRAILIFVLILGGVGLLDAMMGDSTVANLITTLIDMAACIGIALYAGERMGWKAADDTLSSTSVATPP